MIFVHQCPHNNQNYLEIKKCKLKEKRSGIDLNRNKKENLTGPEVFFQVQKKIYKIIYFKLEELSFSRKF